MTLIRPWSRDRIVDGGDLTYFAREGSDNSDAATLWNSRMTGSSLCNFLYILHHGAKYLTWLNATIKVSVESRKIYRPPEEKKNFLPFVYILIWLPAFLPFEGKISF